MNRFVFIFFIFIGTVAKAQDYVPSDKESKVHFTIKNFGFNTGGDFSGLKGDISFSTTNYANSHFTVSVASNTIDTDNSSRDKSLKSEDYFDVEKYPEIKIVSTKIEKTNKTDDGYYYFTGNLILHGITKTISFPFQVQKVNNDYLFTGEFEINRLDYLVGEKSSVLSDKVIVSLKVLAKKK